MLPLTFAVRRAQAADRLPLSRMLELYQHDLSDIYHQELDAHGEFGYALDRYWADARCHPFVALAGGFYAGFALVDASVKIASKGYWMDQFFVLKRHRRLGAGTALAAQVIAQLPGSWEVGQMPSNVAAQAFWRQVIGQITQGRYTEQVIARGRDEWVVQSFESVGQT